MISSLEKDRVRKELELKKENLEEVLDKYSIASARAPEDNGERARFVDVQLVEEHNHKASRQMLADVSAALTRLDKGTWGVCVDCGEEISEDRRSAICWVSRCTPCQKKKGLRIR